MNKKTIFFIIIALLVSATVFLVGYNEVKSPKTIYKVYLDGQAIGLIESKEALEAYINQEQNEIKAERIEFDEKTKRNRKIKEEFQNCKERLNKLNESSFK